MKLAEAIAVLETHFDKDADTAQRVGEMMDHWLNIERDEDDPSKFATNYGNKTHVGLGRVAVRLIRDAINERSTDNDAQCKGSDL